MEEIKRISKKEKTRSSRQKRRTRRAYKIIIPFFAYIALWGILPLLYGLYLGLTEYNGLSKKPVFIGLRNYIDFFTNSAYMQLLWRQIWIERAKQSEGIFPVGHIRALYCGNLHNFCHFYRAVRTKRRYEYAAETAGGVSDHMAVFAVLDGILDYGLFCLEKYRSGSDHLVRRSAVDRCIVI